MTEFFQAITENLAGVSICGVSLVTVFGLLFGLVKILSSNKAKKYYNELSLKVDALKITLTENVKKEFNEILEILSKIFVLVKENKSSKEIAAYINTILSQEGNEELALEYEKNLAFLIENKNEVVSEDVTIVQPKQSEVDLVNQTNIEQQTVPETNIIEENSEDTVNENNEQDEEMIINE